MLFFLLNTVTNRFGARNLKFYNCMRHGSMCICWLLSLTIRILIEFQVDSQTQQGTRRCVVVIWSILEIPGVANPPEWPSVTMLKEKYGGGCKINNASVWLLLRRIDLIQNDQMQQMHSYGKSLPLMNASSLQRFQIGAEYLSSRGLCVLLIHYIICTNVASMIM